MITPVVYFLVFTSIVVHGITIPIGKAGSKSLTMTRTLTFSRSNTNNFSRSNTTNNDVDVPGSDNNLNASGPRQGERRGHLHDGLKLPSPVSAGFDQSSLGVTDSASLGTQSQGVELQGVDAPDTGARKEASRDVRFHDEG